MIKTSTCSWRKIKTRTVTPLGPIEARTYNSLFLMVCLKSGLGWYVYILVVQLFLIRMPCQLGIPLDSTIPQEIRVVARQMGGRSLPFDSPLWRILFPSELLRIDGRVPVDNSSRFLLQMRMNSSKELVGVAFSPHPGAESGFTMLSDFLIAKK